MGLTDQQESLRVRSAVPAGQGQHMFILPTKGDEVRSKNVTRKFQSADGFPESTVREFEQSANGTIWMATEIGLYSYDGYQVQHFDTGLLQDVTCIRAIVHNGHEQIWLGTKSGLAMLSIEKQQIIFVDRFEGVDVLCIGLDHLGHPLVGTTNGLFVYAREEFQKMDSSASKSAVLSIERDLKKATTWIGTGGGLCKLQGVELEPQSLPDLDELPVCKLHLDRLGALWVGTDRSVLRVAVGNVTEVHSDATPRLGFVRNFAESESELSVSLANATIRIEHDQLNADSPVTNFSFRERRIKSSFVDREGNLWTGIAAPPRVVLTRCDLEVLTTHRCQHIFRQPDSDVIWFSRAPARKAQTVVRLQGGQMKSWKIGGLVSDFAWHNGCILVGTTNGVFQLDGDKLVPHASLDLGKKIVFDMATGPAGTLWVTTKTGVYSIYENKVTRHEFSGDFGMVIRVLPSEDGLTVATATKIRHYDNQEKLLEEIDFAEGIASRRVVELLRADDGRLWVGTSCGLFSQKRVGEPSKFMFGKDRFLGLYLACDKDGQLWAGSHSGPCRVDCETMVMQTLLPADISGAQKIHDCLVDGDYTWFTGVKGLFRYRNRASVPELVVDRITSDRELAVDAPVRASTDNELLTVSFHAITPGRRNGSTLYRYRLQGQHEEWSETRRNEIELRDLPVGDYSLELQAFDINMVPSKVVTVPVAVSVPALRYATFIALCVSLLLVLLSLGYVFRYQRRQNKVMADRVSFAVSEQLRLEEGLRQAQKLESLGTLASGMAHDFNNMLQVVSSCSEVARQNDDRDCVLENLSMIQEAASQAQGLTRSMLTLAGSQPQQPEVVDLGDLTSDCLTMIRQTFPQSIEVEQLRNAEEQILVEVDPEQIKQVLVNSFLNARDAMPSGGILSVSIQSVTHESKPLAQVKIRDSGSGIRSENLGRIFEPFYTTKPRGKGTGLGLAIAQGIIRGHNGSIDVESNEGHGTCVTLCLPQTNMANKQSMSPAKELVVAASRSAACKIKALVAEDREPIRELLVRILEHDNFDVLAADNGAKALELAHKARPDVLVLDVDMPILDGLTVLRKIRNSGYDTPAVIISGAPVQDSLPRNTTVLLKPFTSQQLLEAAASHLHRTSGVNASAV